MEKLIYPVSVTQKEQLSGVFIFDFEKSAFLAHPSMGRCGTRMEQEWDRDGTGTRHGWNTDRIGSSTIKLDNLLTLSFFCLNFDLM